MKSTPRRLEQSDTRAAKRFLIARDASARPAGLTNTTDALSRLDPATSWTPQYYALYVELLEVAGNTTTLQGLLRRTKGAKETRDEVIWVQGRVLR